LTVIRKGNILQAKTGEGGLCMLGGIYSDERCKVCGSMLKDDGRKGLFCPVHQENRAIRLKVKLKYKGHEIVKRFGNYEAAKSFSEESFRTGGLSRVDEGGYYYLTDRIKNIIISGRENISPKEVEAVIMRT
jgi:acyl-CoA synthetase (AMP-forming)/AMP-acid ligase II